MSHQKKRFFTCKAGSLPSPIPSRIKAFEKRYGVKFHDFGRVPDKKIVSAYNSVVLDHLQKSSETAGEAKSAPK
ncbi:FEKKY domain-containing protein [Flavobacterium selenitireducens]